MAVLVILNCCSKTCAWSITCCMFYNHLLSPLSQLKWVPDHMLVGLQLVQEHWVLVQSILCAASNVEYVILDVEHLFNYYSDSITHLSVLYNYHWICSYNYIYIYIYIYICTYVVIAIILCALMYRAHTYMYNNIRIGTLNLSAAICISMYIS